TQNLNNYAPTLIRSSLGVIYLAHSAYLKIMVFTIAGTVGFFASLGLPAIVAYLVIAAEIIGGIALIVGYKVRLWAVILTLVSLGATWAHLGAGWLFTNEGGGWEYPAFLAIATFSLVLSGAGRLAIDGEDK
ncbi:MAG: DoxX family protein, partial [Pseudomonadota bacterium]